MIEQHKVRRNQVVRLAVRLRVDSLETISFAVQHFEGLACDGMEIDGRDLPLDKQATARVATPSAFIAAAGSLKAAAVRPANRRSSGSALLTQTFVSHKPGVSTCTIARIRDRCSLLSAFT